MIPIISFFTLFVLSATWFLHQVRHVRLLNRVINEYYSSEFQTSMNKFVGPDNNKEIGMQELNRDVMSFTQDVLRISDKIGEFRKMSYKELEKEYQNIKDIKEMFS